MLTHRNLKAIQEGNRRHPDVMTLLREVKRLRDLIVRAQVMMSNVPMKEFKTETDDLIAFFDAINAEPAVIEYERMRKKREELEWKRRQAQESHDVRTHQSEK